MHLRLSRAVLGQLEMPMKTIEMSLQKRNFRKIFGTTQNAIEKAMPGKYLDPHKMQSVHRKLELTT